MMLVKVYIVFVWFVWCFLLLLPCVFVLSASLVSSIANMPFSAYFRA
jgi:hypothetical protein